MAAPAMRIEQHPDLMGLRMRYDRVAETPVARLVDGLAILAGLFLAISPWVIGFEGLSALTVNNLVTGLVVTVLAVGFSAAYGRMHGIAWVVPVIGAWTIVAPWLVSGGADTSTAIATNVAAGSVCLLVGLAAAAMEYRRLPWLAVVSAGRVPWRTGPAVSIRRPEPWVSHLPERRALLQAWIPLRVDRHIWGTPGTVGPIA
jgi:uncharacterized membrane protein